MLGGFLRKEQRSDTYVHFVDNLGVVRPWFLSEFIHLAAKSVEDAMCFIYGKYFHINSVTCVYLSPVSVDLVELLIGHMETRLIDLLAEQVKHDEFLNELIFREIYNRLELERRFNYHSR